MSRKTLGMISGRVKVADIGSLDSGRYDFLSLENAEPNPGAPSSNNGILASATDGTRSWLIPNQGLSVSGSNDLFVDETGVPIDTTGYNYSSSSVLSDVLADLDQNIANAVAGSLNAVATDTTLTGDGTSSNPLSVATAGDAETLGGELPAYYLNYNNFTNTPTIGDGTITVSGGTGLSGSASFSTNQSTNQTITLANDDRGSSQNIFKNVAVSGQNTIVADSNNDTLNIVGGSSISVTTDSGTDTLTIDFDGTATDNYVDSVTFDSLTGDLTLGRTGSLTDLTANLDGRYVTTETPQNLFETIAVSGQNSIVADSATDTLTFAEGSNVTLTTDSGTDTLTISATDTNDYVNSASFGTADGILTLTRTDTGTVTVDLDGRYLLQSGTATDSDLLDGQQGTYYLNYNNFTNTPTIGNGTLTVSGGTGLSGSGTFDANQTSNTSITLDHADTSSQSSVDNSGATVIQDVTLDGFGHVTNLNSVNLDSRFVNESGDTMTGFLTLHADPTNGLHAATKRYVDDVAQGLNVKPSDYVATTTNLNATYSTANNTLTSNVNEAISIDSTSLTVGETVLVKDQTNAYENGSYSVTQVGDSSNPWILTRTVFMDETDEIPGAFEFIENGATNDSTGWVATVPEDFALNDTTATTDPDFTTKGDIVWVQFSGAGTYTAGAGLDLVGNEFSHTDTSTQGSVDNSGGTVIQDVTLDGFGHVTGLGSVDLDSRYLQSYTETDTLDSVTDRGNSTTNSIDIGSLDVGAPGASSSLVNIDATSPAYIKFWETGSFGMSFGYNGDGSGADNKLEILNDGGATEFEFYNDGRLIAASFSGDGSNLTSVDAATLGGQSSAYHLDYNNFTNTPTIGNGTLTVSGGAGLTGSGTFDANATTNNTITLDHADTSTQGSSTNSGRTYIQSIGLDDYGHVTSLATATETVTDTNDYVTSMSFNTSTGVLTLTRTDAGTVTEDLDGRYLTSYTETDTLDSVTDRGSSTTNTIGVGGVSIDSSYDLDSDTGSTSSTTQTSVASFSSSTYGSAKLVVQISDSVTGERQISELLVAHDGTNAFATEYGVVYTGSAPLATFDADISSGSVRLLATAASGNSTSYTVSETLMV